MSRTNWTTLDGKRGVRKLNGSASSTGPVMENNWRINGASPWEMEKERLVESGAGETERWSDRDDKKVRRSTYTVQREDYNLGNISMYCTDLSPHHMPSLCNTKHDKVKAFCKATGSH